MNNIIPNGWLKAVDKLPYISFLNSDVQHFKNLILPEDYLKVDWIFAASEASTSTKTLEQLLISGENKWWFGHIAYDTTYHWNNIKQENLSKYTISPSFFFEPQFLAISKNSKIEIIIDTIGLGNVNPFLDKIEFKTEPKFNNFMNDISKKTYLENLEFIKKSIKQGDFYEINYCLHWKSEIKNYNSIQILQKLSGQSPAPFSAFYKHNSIEVFCASPERFLKNENGRLLSQPIKGTSQRSSNSILDHEFKIGLQNSIKERAENVMIVDLVRNDLSIHSIPGSIKVTELCNIYSFPSVHQMISSVESNINPNINPLEALKSAFPMGSMTGAPKKIVMETIEYLENQTRGLYSGSLGYITPERNYDFNVVIRSLICDTDQMLAFNSAGSAITWDSLPESEYLECILKTKAIQSLF